MALRAGRRIGGVGFDQQSRLGAAHEIAREIRGNLDDEGDLAFVQQLRARFAGELVALTISK